MKSEFELWKKALAAKQPCPTTIENLEPFCFDVSLVRDIDGDTIVVQLDLGFGIMTQPKPLRLMYIEAPASEGATKVKGDESTAALSKMISGRELRIVTRKGEEFEKYGRYLAMVYAKHADVWVNVNYWMLVGGFAVPYNGGTK